MKKSYGVVLAALLLASACGPAGDEGADAGSESSPAGTDTETGDAEAPDSASSEDTSDF